MSRGAAACCLCLLIGLSSVLQGDAARQAPGDAVIRMRQQVTGLGVHDTLGPEPDDIDDSTVRAHWALLVAGSSGWWNYRHQADVAHAYQVLRAGGLRPEHIVVMVYDDLAWDGQNPFPGQLFNRPGGPDVYRGLNVDYRGKDVTAENFLAVLEGDSSKVAGIGSGKVIASGPNDRVFVFYSDHGSPGLLGMPWGGFMYADQLNAAILRKHKAKGYREMTLYIEACESGSMFEGLLPPDIGVYATTAANAEESSWGTYCPGMDPSTDIDLNTCLGDLYSVAWMEDTECEDGRGETLLDQFERVKTRTSHNNTYIMGSHVMQYGDLGVDVEHTGSYLGTRDVSACMRPSGPALVAARSGAAAHVEQRDADLVPLRVRVARAATPEDRQAAQAALDAVVAARQAVDTGMHIAASRLLAQWLATLVPTQLHATKRALLSNVDGGEATGEVGGVGGISIPRMAVLLAQEMMNRPWGRGENGPAPLVDSWDCLRGAVAAWESACGVRMDQYTMRHTRLFANLCNSAVFTSQAQLSEALKEARACPTHPLGVLM